MYNNYHMIINVQKKEALTLLMAAILSFLLFSPITVSAETNCSFVRDLQLGSEGEDVQCLQKYLNDNGYRVSVSGAGSPGKETSEFKSLTQVAVIKWQIANSISPAAGYFGPKSRQVLAALARSPDSSAPSTQVVAGSEAARLAELVKLKADLAVTLQKQNPSNSVLNKNTDSIHERMEAILDLIEDARDEVRDIDDKDVLEDAEDSLRDAEESFFEGLRAYLDNDFDEAEDLFDDAEDSAEDALENAGSSSEKDEAKNLIKDVDGQIDEAEEEIELADEDGEPTSRAEDIIDEAKDVLDEAEEAFDEGDYEDALELAEEAEDLVKDAIKAIGKSANGGIQDRRR